jgi:NitT/TauT family transport system substrate-binding protein
MHPPSRELILPLLLSLAFLTGCSHPPAAPTPAQTTLMLDWVPEPEFGGFFAASLPNGPFAAHHLHVAITTAGPGAPTWQLVAAGQADFATTAADQVLLARAQGADVVALFAVYQTSPNGVMVHASRHLQNLADVFHQPGLLAAEDDTWLKFCLKKFAPITVTLTGYSGGYGSFLARPDYSQQCFVYSEPTLVKRQGGDLQTFTIADAGYNPYTTVVITRGQLIRDNPALVQAMADSCRQGWRAYLDNPAAANAAMGLLNKEMDADTFTAAAAAQSPLIDTPETKSHALGWMSPDRWQTLRDQMIDLKVLDPAKAPAAETCFTNP